MLGSIPASLTVNFKIQDDIVREALKVYGSKETGFLAGFTEKTTPDEAELRFALKRLYQIFDDETEMASCEDGLKFWRQLVQSRRHNIHILAPLVRALFAIPAASRSAERSFSSMAFLSEGRASLTPEHLAELLVLRDYAHLPKYNLDDFIEEMISCKPDLEAEIAAADSEMTVN